LHLALPFGLADAEMLPVIRMAMDMATRIDFIVGNRLKEFKDRELFELLFPPPWLVSHTTANLQ